ncbi:MAG: rRNA maturation RNase YbeY [Nitrosomonadales bacterium]|nr:rRNA maturation RNase YbeY [Nitrosomonadales bacterium]
MNHAHKPLPYKLSLSVQYASSAKYLPVRHQFRRWVQAALQHDVQITLRIVDENEARYLNKSFRGKDYATNVLAFVYDNELPIYGDLVICAPVAAKEARRQRRSLMEHYAHLTIHAVLHLQGYEHEDGAEAAAMEARETAIMRKLGYADPYQSATP